MKNQLLLLELKKGNRKSFGKIYQLYWNKVYEFTRLYILSEHDCEEIVQEVFIKIWENRKKIDCNQSFDGYLFIITRNMIFNHSRKKINQDFLKTTVDAAISIESDQNILNDIICSDLKQYIGKLIDQLPPRQKEVFKMSRNQKLTYKEIASSLHITPKTVERHINEALHFLRKKVPFFSFFCI